MSDEKKKIEIIIKKNSDIVSTFTGQMATDFKKILHNLKNRKKNTISRTFFIFLQFNNINWINIPPPLSELTMKYLTMFNSIIKKDHRQQRMDIIVILNAAFNILC